MCVLQEAGTLRKMKGKLEVYQPDADQGDGYRQVAQGTDLCLKVCGGLGIGEFE